MNAFFISWLTLKSTIAYLNFVEERLNQIGNHTKTPIYRKVIF